MSLAGRAAPWLPTRAHTGSLAGPLCWGFVGGLGTHSTAGAGLADHGRSAGSAAGPGLAAPFLGVWTQRGAGAGASFCLHLGGGSLGTAFFLPEPRLPQTSSAAGPVQPPGCCRSGRVSLDGSKAPALPPQRSPTQLAFRVLPEGPPGTGARPHPAAFPSCLRSLSPRGAFQACPGCTPSSAGRPGPGLPPPAAARRRLRC